MRLDARENKKKIEQMARSMFDQYGVEEVTMNNLAKALNMGPGTLYRHFTDKSALCYTLIIEDFDDLFKQMNDMHTLQEYIQAFIQFKETHADLMTCIEENPRHNRNNFKQSDAYQQLYQYFYHYYETRTADAQFRTDVLLNALSIHHYHYLRYQRKMTPEEITQKLTSLFDC